ncbi:hypothetical protein [Parasitella parasitica]|uniref:RRN7-type domain-containing protein n=1 Tax=Parasitella parasitica TaxID=35722 RepID=A0A0B7MTZ1_9FUNG|nr:hypothetical protein [Parasitella parasitica]
MKRVCPTCKTRKFKKSSDGGLVCKYGHKLLGVQIEQQEDDFGDARGRQRKRIRTLENDIETASPHKQRSDFLLLFQYTLQVLTRCMVQKLNFPPEIEPVVRELWILYLADSKQEIADAYVFEANEKEAQKQKLEKEDMDLENVEDYSSSDDSDEDGEGQEAGEARQRKGTFRARWPTLSYQQSLVFIYLGCIYLNYPVLPNDLIRWSTTGQIPYLNMQRKIPVDILGSFALRVTNPMGTAPSIAHLQRNIPDFIDGFTKNCNVVFPDLNIPLYLDRLCCQFFLSVEGCYYANYIFEVQRQSRYIDISPHQNLHKTNVLTVLTACVVAAIKLIYGVDGSENSVVSQFDTSTTKEAWFNQISNNLARWKSMEDDRKSLSSMIQHLRDTSVAVNATAHERDKHNMLLNVLNREPVRINHSKETVQTDIFLNTSDLAIQSSSSEDDEKPLIKQGEFYYSRKSSFAPKNYANIIYLASMILGESTDVIEYAMKVVDASVLRNNSSRAISKKRYNEYYNNKT